MWSRKLFFVALLALDWSTLLLVTGNAEFVGHIFIEAGHAAVFLVRMAGVAILFCLLVIAVGKDQFSF